MKCSIFTSTIICATFLLVGLSMQLTDTEDIKGTFRYKKKALSQQSDMVSISANPPVLVQGMTKLLTLRCTFSDMSSSDSSTTPGTEDCTDLLKFGTGTNVNRVTSIVVTRGENKVYVATVNPFVLARSHVDHDSLKVTGHVKGSGTENGLLEMTWTNPGALQADLYTCEVNIINARGHSIVFKKDINITIRPATVEDLIQHIHDLEAFKVENERKVTTLEQEVGALQDQLEKVKSPHVEQDHVYLNPGPEWVEDPDKYFVKLFPITFNQPYDTKPTVHLSICGIAHDGGKDLYFKIYTLNVTEQGFDLVFCTKHKDAVQGARIDWWSLSS